VADCRDSLRAEELEAAGPPAPHEDRRLEPATPRSWLPERPNAPHRDPCAAA